MARSLKIFLFIIILKHRPSSQPGSPDGTFPKSVGFIPPTLPSGKAPVKSIRKGEEKVGGVKNLPITTKHTNQEVFLLLYDVNITGPVCNIF